MIDNIINYFSFSFNLASFAPDIRANRLFFMVFVPTILRKNMAIGFFIFHNNSEQKHVSRDISYISRSQGLKVFLRD